MLTILNVAYPFAPVGLDSVGGAEQVLSQLDQAQTLVGHRSIVVACEGSRVAGTLCATPAAQGPITLEVRHETYRLHRQTIDRALQQWPVDLIHMHGIDFHEYFPPPGLPLLVTLHLPLEWYSPQLGTIQRPNTWMHCVSASQRRYGTASVPLLDDIENGVAEFFFTARHAKKNFAIALGRLCPEKGFHFALDACSRAGVPCLLAGQAFAYPEHQRYFDTEIAPRLNGTTRFIGPVGLARKRRLLSAARCLLVPSLVAETSSLVAMEALACGTPVIAFPAGALPDIVDHGRTGFIVRTVGEMTEAIRSIDSIDPVVCREVARQRFSLERTIARYLNVYRHLAQRSELAVTNTMAAREFATGELQKLG